MGDKYGLHRVLQPQGVLPQPAWKLDPFSPLQNNEILINVEKLNIDSASFVQLKAAASGDLQHLKQSILDIIAQRGKMHNPITGSGGMLIGRVSQIGREFESLTSKNLFVGDTIATLVSLTLTPLSITHIHYINLETGQISVTGKAILGPCAPFAVISNYDLPQEVLLSALDVCGAPAQTARLISQVQSWNSDPRVLILGAGGKSGLLSLAAAYQQLAGSGQILALEYSRLACDEIAQLGLADEVIRCDATDAVGVYYAVQTFTAHNLADIVINCVNIPNTEMASILATSDGGVLCFFSMAISFTQAALGAEGVGKDIQMLIGNGYVPGHADYTVDLLLDNPSLLSLFKSRYATHLLKGSG